MERCVVRPTDGFIETWMRLKQWQDKMINNRPNLRKLPPSDESTRILEFVAALSLKRSRSLPIKHELEALRNLGYTCKWNPKTRVLEIYTMEA